MKTKKLILLEILSVILTFALGVLFHFLYEWLDNNFYVGLFAPQNESVFEHTKLLFYPYIIVSIFEGFFFTERLKDFLTVKALNAVLLVVFTIVGFYTYTGVIGYDIALVDILSVAVYLMVTAIISYNELKSEKSINGFLFNIVLFLAVTATLIWFSIYPPTLPLFTPPIQ